MDSYAQGTAEICAECPAISSAVEALSACEQDIQQNAIAWLEASKPLANFNIFRKS
jgi:hypothetical protein